MNKLWHFYENAMETGWCVANFTKTFVLLEREDAIELCALLNSYVIEEPRYD